MWFGSNGKDQNHHHNHNHFMVLFPGPPRWASARRELLDFMVQGEINRGRHTDHPARRHSIRTNQCPPPPSPHFFYRPEALPAAKPTVSKHWRQLVQGSKVHVKCFVSTCPRETGMSSHQNWKAKYRSCVRSYLTHGGKKLLVKVEHKLIINRTERNIIQRVRGFNVKERKKMRSSLDIWNVHMITAGQRWGRWKQTEGNGVLGKMGWNGVKQDMKSFDVFRHSAQVWNNLRNWLTQTQL